ncbi:MAG: flagellar biosynthesis anti-sigma factor FlgM [Spirochaetia bacterium]|nr:flagellar biosynthesis anti-sigma factor FlgM [Spirochaetia bacterium]
MTINKINQVNETQAGSIQPKAPAETTPVSRDSVSISADGQKKAELAKYIEVVRNAPDIRADKVEEARKNLASYMQDSTVNKNVLDTIVEKLFRNLYK